MNIDKKGDTTDDTQKQRWLEKRILFFEGNFTEKKVSAFRKDLLELVEKDKTSPVTIHIDSFGGSVYEFLSLYSLLSVRKFHLTTVVLGKAMSAGAYLHLLGDERIAYPHATIMHHELSSSCWGKLHELEIDHVESKRLQNLLTGIVKKQTNIENPEEWLKEDKFLTPLQAKKLGIITKIKRSL